MGTKSSWPRVGCVAGSLGGGGGGQSSPAVLGEHKGRDRQTDSCEGGGQSRLEGGADVRMTFRFLSKPLPTRCFLCTQFAGERGERVLGSGLARMTLTPAPPDSPGPSTQIGEKWCRSPEARLSRGPGAAVTGVWQARLATGTPTSPPNSGGQDGSLDEAPSSGGQAGVLV